MTRHALRAAQRHDVWRRAYQAARAELERATPDTTDEGLADVWRDTRDAVLAYLEARSRGSLPSPPGGVGSTAERRTPTASKLHDAATCPASVVLPVIPSDSTPKPG